MPRKLMGRRLREPSGEWAFVYALIDPESNEVRYVGCTTDLTQRYQAHLNLIGFHRWVRAHARDHAPPPTTAKTRWIYRLIDRGLYPEMRVLRRVRPWEGPEVERECIEEYAAAGHPLFNAIHHPTRGSAREDPLGID
jgi:hypothetical protein